LLLPIKLPRGKMIRFRALSNRFANARADRAALFPSLTKTKSPVDLLLRLKIAECDFSR
jgi:hypothetical protein